ncbi:hypothetical protein A11A3_07563 [Alcanivorax hongdengensis A-11-3]|uniref:DUF3301 domain-containing protein n=1 Tax=Alcanivorax hongdengensis A-11-3 TaxID=1177179 RepID=L0WCC8_9GAMM|nr:DUF3301 domain-containing protein [Alcanivorax hongdengensis]EKF74659.1 hypothetical protein A11A3_07563 [Alcanivorax hongdengensis A-11-3]
MNLQLQDLLLVTAVVVIAALFWRAHGIRERALAVTRRYCERQELEFLDDTVGLERLTLDKDRHGKRRLTRIYHFEFTVTGGERYSGRTYVQSGMVQRIELPPHRYTPPPEQLH